MFIMYLFFAMIGAGADMTAFLVTAPIYFVLGLVVILVHVAVVLVAARLLRADLAEAIIGSGANIVGAAAAAGIATSKGGSPWSRQRSRLACWGKQSLTSLASRSCISCHDRPVRSKELLRQRLERPLVALEPLEDRHIEALRGACAADPDVWTIYPVCLTARSSRRPWWRCARFPIGRFRRCQYIWEHSQNRSQPLAPPVHPFKIAKRAMRQHA